MKPAPADPDLCRFEPSALRARRLDARMRERLAESLRHVVERAGDALDADALPLEAFHARLSRGPVRPQVFGAYADLVLAVQQGRMQQAAGLLAELVGLPPPEPGVGRVVLGDPARDAIAARWQRLVDADPAEPVALCAAPAQAARGCAAALEEGLELLRAADPELHAELEALLREVALAASPSGAAPFDGASSLFLWGAVLVNAGTPRTPAEVVRLLAHESAHNLLFGIGCDQELVENPPQERRASPLREGARPLAGTFHATFVLARVSRVTRRLLDSGRLPGGERDAARRALARGDDDFARGLAIIERHARLTPLGEAVLAGARSFMQGA